MNDEKQNNDIKIIMASDVTGIVPNATAISSILKHTDRNVHVRLFSRDFLDYNIQIDRLKIEIINTPENLRLEGHIPDHIMAKDVYDRFVAMKYCTDWDRGFILDYDQVVIGNIDELFELDFEGNLLAGNVSDVNLGYATEEWFKIKIPETYEFTRNYKVYYFGILLNLKQLQKEKIFDDFRRCVETNYMNDYLGLFTVCQDRVLEIPSKFGVLTHWNEEKIPRDIRIIHFNGEEKPWDNFCIPFSEMWYKNYLSWKALTQGQWDPYDRVTRVKDAQNKKIPEKYHHIRYRFPRIFSECIKIQKLSLRFIPMLKSVLYFFYETICKQYRKRNIRK